MSLLETRNSTGEVSLTALFDGNSPRAADPGMTVADVIDRICVGGWPLFAHLDAASAQRALRAYLEEVSHTDIHRLDGVRHDPQRVQRVVRSLARHVSTPTALRAIASDTGQSDDPINRQTVDIYIDALRRLMVIEDVPAWAPALRSRARLRAADNRHFIDPCLAVAALRASPRALLNDLLFTGLLFEGLVVRDLRVYSQQIGGTVMHYRDSNDLEVDVIVETDDGRWAAIEVKLGVGQIDAAAATLRRFAEVVDISRVGEPAFLGVATATGFAYRRDDGVCVLPIGTLGP